MKSEDHESLNAARELIKQEGLLCGGSSGAALSTALKIAKDLPADKRMVVVLPDGIRNYMTKFVADGWMEERNFLVKNNVYHIEIFVVIIINKTIVTLNYNLPLAAKTSFNRAQVVVEFTSIEININ